MLRPPCGGSGTVGCCTRHEQLDTDVRRRAPARPVAQDVGEGQAGYGGQNEGDGQPVTHRKRLAAFIRHLPDMPQLGPPCHLTDGSRPRRSPCLAARRNKP